MDKNELLKYVTDRYLTSHDFNGVAVYDMPSFDKGTTRKGCLLRQQ